MDTFDLATASHVGALEQELIEGAKSIDVGKTATGPPIGSAYQSGATEWVATQGPDGSSRSSSQARGGPSGFPCSRERRQLDRRVRSLEGAENARQLKSIGHR